MSRGAILDSPPAAESTDWKSRYYASLDELEKQATHSAALQQALIRAVKRLCAAARGIAPPVDAVLGRLSTAVENDPGPDQIAELVDALSDAVRLAENPPSAAEPARAHNGESPLALRDALLQLLDDIQLTPDQAEARSELRANINSDPDALPGAAEKIVALINADYQTLIGKQGDLERILVSVNKQLEDLTAYLNDEAATTKDAHRERSEFSDTMAGEIKAIDTSVQEARDLSILKGTVSQRMAALNQRLHTFRTHEEERIKQFEERNAAMQHRIETLEKESRELRESLHDQREKALTDQLTGIPNRAAYEEQLPQYVTRWQRYQHPLCVAVWDIDLFKSINDNFGHRTGDKVIRIIGQYLLKNIRGTDFVARFGGEEFVMLLENMKPGEVHGQLDKVRRGISKMGLYFRKQPVKLSISCGIAFFREGDLPEDVFSRADEALYTAKSQGRNQCVVNLD